MDPINWYRNRLSPSDQQIYDYIYNAIVSNVGYFEVEGIDPSNDMSQEKFLNIWNAIIFDNAEPINFVSIIPEYAYNNHRYNVKIYKLKITNDEIESFNENLDSVISTICSQLSDNYTRVESVEACYKYILEHVKYDFKPLDVYDKIDKNNGKVVEDYYDEYGASFTAYGALMNKKATCNGIALLFKLLCDRLLIPCICIPAEIVVNDSHTVNHRLNVVDIDGQNAYVDVTLGMDSKAYGINSYKGLLCNQEIIEKMYKLNPQYNFECLSNDNWYYTKKKLIFKNRNEVRHYLESVSLKNTKDCIRIYYNGTDMDEKQLKKLCNNVINKHCLNKKIISIGPNYGFFEAVVSK